MNQQVDKHHTNNRCATEQETTQEVRQEGNRQREREALTQRQETTPMYDRYKYRHRRADMKRMQTKRQTEKAEWLLSVNAVRGESSTISIFSVCVQITLIHNHKALYKFSAFIYNNIMPQNGGSHTVTVHVFTLIYSRKSYNSIHSIE